MHYLWLWRAGTIASTAIHNMNTPIPMRSQTPINGVGRFASSPGALHACQSTECHEHHHGCNGVEPESLPQGHRRESNLEHEEEIGHDRPDDVQGVG